MPEQEAEEGARELPRLLLHLLAGLIFRERIAEGERHSHEDQMGNGESTPPVAESVPVDVNHGEEDRVETDGRLERAQHSHTVSLR